MDSETLRLQGSRSPVRPRFALLTAVMLAACQSGPTYHEDIKPIIEGRCVGCHKEGGVAPFSLQSFDAVSSMAPRISDAVKSRRMPPWRASAADVKYVGDPTLTQEQVDAVVAWAKNGTPEGDKSAKVEPLPPLEGGLDRVDLTLEMARPFSPSTEPDEYRCFVIDWPYQDVRYVTGFNAVPGNTKIVHHIAVFVVPPQDASRPVEWDNAAPGDGYPCYGGPAGDKGGIPILLLSAWTPGGEGTKFRDGVGIAVQPGSKLVLQQHYNNGLGETDQTKLDFRIDTTVTRRAVYAPWLKIDWPLGLMKIPAGAEKVQHVALDDPREFFKLFAPDIDLSRGFDVHSALFHMHTLGKTGKAGIFHADQSRTTFLNIENWDFKWQREYKLEEPVAFLPGDKVELRCVFDNSPSRQRIVSGEQLPPKDVNWGEGTEDEMCVVDMLITPR